jgi:hypothetical protein
VGFSGKLPISDFPLIPNFQKYYPVLFNIAAPFMNIFVILDALFGRKVQHRSHDFAVRSVTSGPFLINFILFLDAFLRAT